MLGTMRGPAPEGPGEAPAAPEAGAVPKKGRRRSRRRGRKPSEGAATQGTEGAPTADADVSGEEASDGVEEPATPVGT